MATTAALRTLPSSLLILFVACVAAPLWSLLALASPAEVWQTQGAWPAVLLVVAYWVMPPALAITIVLRSPMFLPLFVGECVSLLIYLSFFGAATSDVFYWGRYAAIGMVALAGVFISSKDLLAPFLSFDGSEWRKTPRLPSSIRMHARLLDGTRCVEIVVDDFSMQGMAISLNGEDLGKGAQMQRGDKLTVLESGHDNGAVTCEIAWVKTDGPLVSLGLKAVDEAAMAGMVTAFRQRKKGLAMPFWLGRLWLNPMVRRTTMVLWAALIAGAFVSPAWSPKPQPEAPRWTSDEVPPVAPRQ